MLDMILGMAELFRLSKYVTGQFYEGYAYFKFRRNSHAISVTRYANEKFVSIYRDDATPLFS